MDPAAFDLRALYEDYAEVEDAFGVALDDGLSPRGPESLYDIVADLGLPHGARAVEVWCGEGRHSVELAQRFGLTVLGGSTSCR